MSLYDLPSFSAPKINFPKIKSGTLILTVVVSSIFGFLAGLISGNFFLEAPVIEKIIEKQTITEKYVAQTTQEQAIINAVNEVSPAVVNIVISKDLPVYEQYYLNPFFYEYRQKGIEKQNIGSGTGFIVSKDGMILTNKHVVLDEEAEYAVFTNDGKKFSAKVLARDPLQDLAVLKIESEKTIDSAGALFQKDFPIVKFGDSDNLQIGQTVIAIGNALGEFRNTVSVGVVSGLGRTITASSGDFVETIEDVIQTDAAINKGNSGGPLLNLKGEVIGINTATVLDAQSIGFAIPVNKAKKDIEQVVFSGKIVYPYLGVYYTLITANLREKFDLPVDYGAWIGRDASGNKTDEAVVKDSAAQIAGIQRDDIILEISGAKINIDNSLAKHLQKYDPGDKVSLKVLRGSQELILEAVLGERIE